MCGGAQSAVVEAFGVAGLSPRVRGSLPKTIPDMAQIRSIPACAGEPIEGKGKRSEKQVYPRVCGGAFSTFDSFVWS